MTYAAIDCLERIDAAVAIVVGQANPRGLPVRVHGRGAWIRHEPPPAMLAVVFVIASDRRVAGQQHQIGASGAVHIGKSYSGFRETATERRRRERAGRILRARYFASNIAGPRLH